MAEKSWRVRTVLVIMLAECRLGLLPQIRQGGTHFRETHCGLAKNTYTFGKVIKVFFPLARFL